MKLPQEVNRAIEILKEKQARDIVVLNLGKLAGFTDYFIICTGESSTQVKTISNELVERLPSRKPHGKEGYPAGPWVLLDYGDMIIHVFLPEARNFYDLEKAWHDAPVMRVEEPEKTGEEARED